MSAATSARASGMRKAKLDSSANGLVTRSGGTWQVHLRLRTKNFWRGSTSFIRACRSYFREDLAWKKWGIFIEWPRFRRRGGSTRYVFAPLAVSFGLSDLAPRASRY